MGICRFVNDVGHESRLTPEEFEIMKTHAKEGRRIIREMKSNITAVIIGEGLPPVRYMGMAMLLGFVAYGLSIFMYIRAQRSLGAAKTSAYYAIAPFIGALLSFVIAGEPLTESYLAALAFMIIGTVFVVLDTVTVHHTHEHTHTFLHEHDGSAHYHTITHSHGHNHYSETDKHTHTHHHNTAQLEKELKTIHRTL